MTPQLISPLGYDGLDIVSIREKFKQYCIDNGIIKDVNYLGSNMSLQLDIIAYAIQNINATQAMVSNQTKIPTATIRQNILHLAKQIGYEITRPISSKLNITLSATLAPGVSITIPAWSKWVCGAFKFLNPIDVILTNSVPSVTLDLVEGSYIDSNVDSTLLYALTTETGLFVLNYKNIEDTSIKMLVKRDGATDWEDSWVTVDSLLDLEFGVNNIYEEYDADAGWVNVYTIFSGAGNAFGTGDTVKFSFIVSNGSAANGISSCKPDFKSYNNLGVEVTLGVTVNSSSRGGQDEESDQSVKSNAPLFYNTGNRTVNEYDYKAFLEQSSLVLVANAWGGELHIPEKLGHIYFTAIPQDTNDLYIANLDEVELLNILSKARIMSTKRIHWHPAYFTVDFSIKILGIVPDIATRQQNIQSALESYFSTDLNGFNVAVYQSKIIRVIENVFTDVNNASVVVSVLPKLKLSQEMFTNNLNDATMMVTPIPNSSKRYYLTKGSDRIYMPENNVDLVSYYANGWVKKYQPDEDLDVVFTATIGLYNLTTGASYVSGGITKKDITYNAIVVGYFDVTNSVLYLDNTFKNNFTTPVDINVTYTPAFNVKFAFNSYPVLGTVTYV